MRTSTPVYLGQLLFLTLVYFLLAKGGLALAIVHPSASAVWPPTGLTIAAYLLLGYRVWPAFFIGAFIANLTTAGSIATSLAIGVGNAGEGFLAAWLLNRFARGAASFTHPAGVFKFVLFGAGIAPILSATVGMTSLCVGGYASWSDYPHLWITWWLGDASGALIVTPVIVLWTRRPILQRPTARVVEGVALLLTLAAVLEVVFGDIVKGGRMPLGFLCLPVLIWAAFRFGPRAAATTTLLISGVAVWRTLPGGGPFAQEDPNEALLMIQLFMDVLALTSLAAAAAVSQQRRVEEQRSVLLAAEQDARSRAEAAIKQRDEFLSTAAHELRTPVAAVKGAAQLLMRRQARGELDPERLLLTIAAMDEAAERLAQLVSDLLDVSRIEVGQLPLRPEPLDFAALVTAELDHARDDPHPRHTFSLEVDTPEVTVMGDLNRLGQVVTQMLDNAVKYSPSGGAITLRVWAEEEGLILAVSDPGIGFPAGSEASMFQPFGRAANAQASHLSGMGLGLYIAQNIVKGHNGRMWLESAGEEHGATAFIWLPRAATTLETQVVA